MKITLRNSVKSQINTNTQASEKLQPGQSGVFKVNIMLDNDSESYKQNEELCLQQINTC